MVQILLKYLSSDVGFEYVIFIILIASPCITFLLLVFIVKTLVSFYNFVTLDMKPGLINPKYPGKQNYYTNKDVHSIKGKSNLKNCIIHIIYG